MCSLEDNEFVDYPLNIKKNIHVIEMLTMTIDSTEMASGNAVMI